MLLLWEFLIFSILRRHFAIKFNGCWAYLDQRGELGDFCSEKLLYLSHSFLFITKFSHLELGRYQAPCHEVGDDPGVSSGPVLGELLGGGFGLVGHGDPGVSSGPVLGELLGRGTRPCRTW